MSTQSISATSATRFHHTSRDGSALLPVAILLTLCFLSFTTALLRDGARDDAPAWVEVVQYAE